MKTENPTNTRKVQLMPIIANVQKLISPSPVEQKHFHCKDYNRHQVLTENVIIPTWEVVSADLLRKKLVVLLHLLASKMAKSFVLTDVTIFCPSGCHNFLSSGCPQEGFGVRLSHSSFNQIVGLSRHSIFTVWHRSVPNQLGNWRKKTL